MYLLVRRISKLSARRGDSRFFSTLPLSPYLKLRGRMLRECPEGYVVDQTFFDPKTATEECLSEKTVPISRQFLMGASKGWLVGLKDEDCKVSISDLYKPWVSSPRVISLPSVGNSGGGPFYFYAGVASISSSDPNLGDNFNVAAVFRRDRLSFLRSRESSWTHVESQHSPASSITYSKRDKVFYFTSKGLYLGILDIIHAEIKFDYICLRDLPKLSVAGWSYLNRKCILTNHVVEAPSGELFFIMWYTQCHVSQMDDGDGLEWDKGGFRIDRIKPKRFLVFREDEKTKEFWYTQDIGDLCIFLGASEAFCVSASMYPGLIPNSIYYVRGPGLGCYNVASAKPRALSKIDGNYWIEPVA